MERWAANTLRTLGIILTAGLVLIVSLILVLLSMCASSGDFGGNKHPEQVVPYLVGAALVVILGVFIIARLARGIFRSAKVGEGAGATGDVVSPALPLGETAAAVPLHLSPLGRQALDRLVFAVGAQIALSAISFIFNTLHFWRSQQRFAPHTWPLILLAPLVLYQIPYAVLIYLLVKRPDRRAFTYAVTIPAVQLVQSLFSLTALSYFMHQPRTMLLLGLPWLLHIVILVLAYQAIQQIGLHPEPASLLVTAVLVLVYFLLIHAVFIPVLYRFRM
jgi:hypothetical protein